MNYLNNCPYQRQYPDNTAATCAKSDRLCLKPTSAKILNCELLTQSDKIFFRYFLVVLLLACFSVPSFAQQSDPIVFKISKPESAEVLKKKSPEERKVLRDKHQAEKVKFEKEKPKLVADLKKKRADKAAKKGKSK